MPATTTTDYPASGGAHPRRALVEIVADGGAALGYGHVGRCLAVWEALDGDAVFAVAEPAVAAFVRARGAPAGAAPTAPIVLLDRAEPTTAEQVAALQATGRRVVLLDDLGAGRAVADLVVDPPTAARWPPTGQPRVGGFEHVLLRREVRAARRAGEPRGALLALGGSDPAQLTPGLAAALAGAGVEELVVNLGPGYGGAVPAGVTLLRDPAAFVATLAATGLLIAAYGHALLEAALLGVPAVIVVTRVEHREHAAAFAAHGTALIIDMSDEPRPLELAELVTAAIARPERLQAMAARGPALVDGRGAERVAAAIRALA
jgi:hypothetical protein